MLATETTEFMVWATPSFMTIALFMHIAGGSVGLVSGFTAVLARKGETVHRIAGSFFFIAMLAMGTFAALLAGLKDQTGNLVGGVTTVYLVSTAWLAVKRPEGRIGRVELVAFLVATVVAALSIAKGVQPGVDSTGLPNTVSLVFGLVIALAALCDLKVLLQRGVSSAGRISRHLWRMCLALFVASGSFFFSQMEIMFPGTTGPWIWAAGLAPFGFLIFWMIRVRIGRAFKSATPSAGRVPA